jgi:hypothetical protein
MIRRSLAEIRYTLLQAWEQMQSDGIDDLMLVRAWLYSPVAIDVIGGNPLDDLLCVAVLRHFQIPIDDLGDMHPEPVFIPAPLARVSIGGTWIYATSWRRCHPVAMEMVRRKRKHFFASRFVGGQQVDTKSGRFRSYDLASACVTTPYVEWTVRGSRAWLERLLPLVGSIGKDRNSGLGSIASWEIASTTRDPVLEEGVPQRGIPCSGVDTAGYRDCVLAERTIRPPYVWPGTRMLCALPAFPS